ncbi:FAD dependent oxidoreductase [Coniochaeta hoffmannii]|uniref:FAD dependent oxidoreductase n=1 Tax=Coniochaeta hoffmannii TaxID=91930 RepID=A0AA38SEI0_9PEZI|nr:FAD dependent oxidoreductase [Coniochaeta hoffmannii]
MDADASSSVPSNPAFTPSPSPTSSSPFHNFGTTTSTSTAAPTSSPFSPPSSILIIGSGVFGLSTAYALARRDVFSNTTITVVDRASSPSPSSTPVFPARDASSIDSSRIIRGDYADPAYAALATEALRQWRNNDSPGSLGAEGRYNECGLVLVADAEPQALSALANPSSSSTTPNSGASLLEQHNAKKTGIDYVRASWENAVALSAQDAELASRIRLLPDPAAIRDAVGTGGTSGTTGYINGYAGWADADRSMAWLYSRVAATDRVSFVQGTVSALVHTDDAVTGATLASGQTLSADLVILAAGAWTPSLLDLSGQATATGQAVAYLPLTDEEQASLSGMPVLLNLTTGLFIIPPSNNTLKVARHAYGYLNPSSSTTSRNPVSLPRTNLTTPSALSLPPEATSSLRSALREMLPSHTELHDRPFSQERLCWYTDTPTGDFIISYHPRYGRSLFVATGGSGHGFKFLPVLGDKIVDAVEGRTPEEFVDKWAWKETGEGSERAVVVVTEDGSRGGVPGLVLDEEMARMG